VTVLRYAAAVPPLSRLRDAIEHSGFSDAEIETHLGWPKGRLASFLAAAGEVTATDYRRVWVALLILSAMREEGRIFRADVPSAISEAAAVYDLDESDGAPPPEAMRQEEEELELALSRAAADLSNRLVRPVLDLLCRMYAASTDDVAPEEWVSAVLADLHYEPDLLDEPEIDDGFDEEPGTEDEP